jgi:hypothetical protein
LIFQPRHPGVHGLFDFLPDLYAQSSETSALSYATKATALAAFGNVAGQPKDRLSPLAWRTYGCALSELNAALTDPLLARRNETLMTVLLFCMAESLLITKHPETETPTSTTHAPISHIDGAVSLLKLRGTELLSSDLSARLFLAVRTHMMIERMQQGKPLDAYFYSPTTGWQHEVAPALQNPANRLTQYTLLVPALRSRATSLLQQSRTQWNIYAVSMLLHEVRSIDIMLSTWPASIPDSWQYTAVSRACWSSRTPLPADYPYEIYPGTQDGYADIWLASVWNTYRISRLFLNAITVRCVEWLSASTTTINPAEEDPEHITATLTIQNMADDICSSVPFFLGYDASALPPSLLFEHLSDLPSDKSPSCTFRPAQPSAIHAYFLLWPLFVCRSAVSIPTSQRSFLRSRMLAIAERFGIQQARMLVEVGDLEGGRPLFSRGWEKGVFERMWEHANLYASSGI